MVSPHYLNCFGLFYPYRTSVNVHVELTDLSSEGGDVHVDRETSTRLSSAFSSSSFLSTAALHIGGGSPLLQAIHTL